MAVSVCKLDDIEENDAKGFNVEGLSIVVAKKDGMLFAYTNVCPHLGIELNFQPDVFMDLDKRYLHCANHGALFQIEDGMCVHGPCSGQSLQALPGSMEGDEFFVELV